MQKPIDIKWKENSNWTGQSIEKERIHERNKELEEKETEKWLKTALIYTLEEVEKIEAKMPVEDGDG